MHYTLRNLDKICYFKIKQFLVITEWNKLEPSLRRCDSYNVFKSNILKFIWRSSNWFFDCSSLVGIEYVTRIQLGLSHPRENKFKYSFQDTLNPICNCGNDVESGIHFFLHCLLYSNERHTILEQFSQLRPYAVR